MPLTPYSPMQQDMSYDDMVTFARAMYEVEWRYSGPDSGERLLDFFESPHKWDVEYQKWREFGGTLDKECLNVFEEWYVHKDDPQEDEDADTV